MIKSLDDNGDIRCVCKECGNEFVLSKIPVDSLFADYFRSMADVAVCDDCVAKRKVAEEKERIANQRKELEITLDERMLDTGIPPVFATLDKPFNRETAKWVWQHREQSLVLGGPTGTGKTSSAAFVARLMLRDEPLRVKYLTRQGLVARFVKAKTDDAEREQGFYRWLSGLDILIIDEMVGKRGSGKMSDSSQEMLFSLVDGVYSRTFRTRIWMLGNFYDGSFDDLVDDPAPFKRRLSESFAIGWTDGDRTQDRRLAR